MSEAKFLSSTGGYHRGSVLQPLLGTAGRPRYFSQPSLVPTSFPSLADFFHSPFPLLFLSLSYDQYPFFSTPGPRFEEMMKQLRSDLTANPPLAGSFTPKKGSSCVAQFSDGLWCVCMCVSVTSSFLLAILLSCTHL